MPSYESKTRIPVDRETRDEILKPLKRGGQTYDSLLRDMAAQYDPETAREGHHGF